MNGPLEPLPPALNTALGGVPKSLVPATVKALDRLIGGAIDIPAAWLAQKKAQIDAQTEAYKAVESAIANAAAAEAGGDPAIVARAVEVLVRKSYRGQRNREAVAASAVEELETSQAGETPQLGKVEGGAEIDEEWLNVFEQYAERASTERMQKLWGRVLAGEIRRPGQFSMRALRFLSEFSQDDAVSFANVALSAFGEVVAKKLVVPAEGSDMTVLMNLEAAGLIQGTTSLGLTLTLNVNEHGVALLDEGPFALIFEAEPNAKVRLSVFTLTPIARELIALVPERDPLGAARRLAFAVRAPEMKSAYLGVRQTPETVRKVECLWSAGGRAESKQA